MDDSIYERFSRELDERGAGPALAALADALAGEGRAAELFEARLMQARHELGLPLAAGTTLDELPDGPRAQLEERYLDACREVGRMLLACGSLGEAWRYLRVVGERDAMAQALAARAPSDDEILQWIEIAVAEGVAPALGFEWLIAHYGTCQAITSFDAQMHQRPRAQQQAVAGVLVRRLHGELVANVRDDLARRGGDTDDTKAGAIVAAHPELLADDNYHVDTSHLASVVRFARVVEDSPTLELAFDLADYGSRLSPQYHYRSEEPFASIYADHRLFFAAQLGREVDAAVTHFREQAARAAGAEQGAVAAEVYVALLARMGRAKEAFDAGERLLPTGWRGSALCPSLGELAAAAGQSARFADQCRQRGDALGFAASLVAADAAAHERKKERSA